MARVRFRLCDERLALGASALDVQVDRSARGLRTLERPNYWWVPQATREIRLSRYAGPAGLYTHARVGFKTGLRHLSLAHRPLWFRECPSNFADRLETSREELRTSPRMIADVGDQAVTPSLLIPRSTPSASALFIHPNPTEARLLLSGIEPLFQKPPPSPRLKSIRTFSYCSYRSCSLYWRLRRYRHGKSDCSFRQTVRSRPKDG